jgi:hypothetical protein
MSWFRLPLRGPLAVAGAPVCAVAVIVAVVAFIVAAAVAVVDVGAVICSWSCPC